MTDKFQKIGLAVMLAILPWGIALAEEHTNEALHHATEAAKSAGESKAVGEHASQALQHLEAAKAANPASAKQLEQSEADLRSAVTHSQHFNSDSAAKDAADAKAKLEAVHK